MNEAWDNDSEEILENLRINSHNLSIYHKEQYYSYKKSLKYFKIPIIVLSSITSVASVGMATYISQEDVSLFTCLMSLFSAIIGSIELYLGIQTTMDISLDVSRQYQILAYDIYKTLSLNREHRSISGKDYLEEKFKDYLKITENASLILGNKVPDALAPIPEKYKMKMSSSLSKMIKTSPKSDKYLIPQSKLPNTKDIEMGNTKDEGSNGSNGSNSSNGSNGSSLFSLESDKDML